LFARSKVIYSAYNDEFPGSLNKNFRKKLMLKGISTNDVKALDDPTYVNLSKLAIQFSDALIQGSSSVNPEVEKMMQESGKTFLPYQPKESYIEAYNAFYDKI
jgi:starch synthase